MAEKCNVTPQKIDEIKDQVSDILDQFEDLEDSREFSRAARKALVPLYEELASQLNMSQVNSIAKAIYEQCAEYDLAEYDAGYFNLTNIKNILLDTNKGLGPSQDNLDSKVDNVQDQEKPKTANRVSRDFVNNYYFKADRVRQVAEKQAINSFINAMILNRITGEVVENTTSLNNNLRNLQEQLFKDIINYLRTTSSDKIKSLPENISLYKEVNGKLQYTGVFDDIQDVMVNYISNTRDILPDLYEKVKGGLAETKEVLKLKAINSYFLLNNFDQYLKLSFGKSIQIEDFGQFSVNPEKYKISDKGSNVYTTWRVSENINVESEINNLTKLLIESIPKYNWDSRETPLTDAYLSFSDFGYTISKVKMLSSDPRVSELVFKGDNINDQGWWNSLTSNTRNLLRYQSLSEVINKIRLNPQVYLEAIFELLANNEFKKAHPEVYKDLGQFDLNNIYTIYRGIFSTQHNESINKIIGNRLDNVYYSYITQTADSIFSVKYLQYYVGPDGVKKLRTLHDQGIDRIANEVEQYLNTGNSKHTRNYSDIISKYKVKLPEDLTKDSVIGINIPNTNIVLSIDIKSGNVSYNDISGASVSVNESMLNDNNIRQFIQDTTGLIIGLDTGNDFSRMLVEVYNNNKLKLISDLLSLSADIIANQAVMTKLEYNTPEELRKQNEVYYGGTDKIDINYELAQNNLVRNSNTSIILRIAEATAAINGLATSLQVKDGEGNAQSVTTLSRLLGSFRTQWEVQGKENKGVSQFSILKNNIFKGVATAKEYYDGQQAKAHTDWTVAEFAYSNFILDYLGGYSSKEGRYEVGNGLIALIPSVNSDKSTIGRIILDTLELFGKELSKVSINDIAMLISKELGGVYENTLDNIIEDLRLVFNESSELNEFDARSEYLSGFAKINEKFGKTSVSILQKACREYNSNHPLNRITLIDQVHFINKKGNLASNRALLSLAYRFGTKYDRYQPGFTTLREWMYEKDKDVLTSALNSNFQIDLSSNQPELGTLKGMVDWVDSNSNKAVLAKMSFGGHSYNITSRADVIKIVNQLGVNPIQKIIDYNNSQINDISNKLKDIRDQIDKLPRNSDGTVHPDFEFKYITLSQQESVLSDQYEDLMSYIINLSDETYNQIVSPLDKLKYIGSFQLHSELQKFNYLQYLFSQEFIISTVGSHIAHPDKAKVAVDPMVEEALRYNAQHKRNVSMTASMHAFQLGVWNGIPDQYNIAITDDIKTTQSNFAGAIEDGIKPFDGATFVNPIVVILENMSLGGDKAGVDKKQFVHFWDTRTATGGIIKTAGFGNTNSKMRNSNFWKIHHLKTSSKFWIKRNGEPFIADVTKFIYNEKFLSDYFYKGKDGQFYKITNIQYLGDNQYERTSQLCSIDGTVNQDAKPVIDRYIHNPNPTNPNEHLAVNNAYQLHQMLGGWRSVSYSDNTKKKLVFSEKSLYDTADIINHFNEDGELITDSRNFWQPMKHALIHYEVTGGAIKQGPGNTNGVEAYLNNGLDLDYMTIQMNQAGIQLDKEHHADQGELSLFTQVINACAFNGFTFEHAQELYEGLAAFSRIRTKDFSNAFDMFKSVEDPTKLKDSIINIVIDSLSDSSTDSSSFIYKTASELIKKAKEGKTITFADSKLPISDPSIFNKVVQSVSSFLTKSGIKVKIPGLLAVLHPSVGIMKIYGGRKLGSFNDPETEIPKLQEEFDANPVVDSTVEGFLNKIADIKLDRKYKVWYADGTFDENVKIVTPLDYFKISDQIREGKIIKVVENILEGRDLGSYNAVFSTTDGQRFNLYDIDVVRELFYLENPGDLDDPITAANYEEYLQTLASKYLVQAEGLTIEQTRRILNKKLRKELQYALDAVSPSNKRDQVTVKGVQRTIIKSSLEIDPYEVVMPKIFATNFGLTAEDSLHDILSDKLFFTKKLLQKYSTQIDSSLFDIELKNTNGKHTYILTSEISDKSDLEQVKIQTDVQEGKVLRVDLEGNVIQELSSRDDIVYRDKTTGVEVIYTKNPGFYLDNYSYVGINLSEQNFNTSLEVVKTASNSTAKRYINYLEDSKDALQANNDLNAVNSVVDVSTLDFEKLKELRNKNHQIVLLAEAGDEIYASFQKSLDITAARIPAQSQQSFMPMRIIAFEDEDVNRAYVSAAQIWLQGSRPKN